MIAYGYEVIDYVDAHLPKTRGQIAAQFSLDSGFYLSPVQVERKMMAYRGRHEVKNGPKVFCPVELGLRQTFLLMGNSILLKRKIKTA